jgi:hypothetical protein
MIKGGNIQGIHRRLYGEYILKIYSREDDFVIIKPSKELDDEYDRFSAEMGAYRGREEAFGEDGWPEKYCPWTAYTRQKKHTKLPLHRPMMYHCDIMWA